jgi:hypothetical protein
MFNDFFNENRAVGDNVEKMLQGRTDDNVTRRTRIAYWITKATDENSEYIILIALPLQQRLHESVSMLCYT